MNHIYRLVWSSLAQAWVAVAENARAHGKATRAGTLAAALGTMLIAPSGYAANAADATVTLGNGSVSTVGNTTTIKQNSQNLAIDWTGLSTAANEALIFNQPNSSAIALNRITGSSPSTLLGSLTANGQVFILNPNGVLFGAGSQVNVGGLVASTLGMSNADLEAGRMVFALDGNANGSVVNKGKINATDGGYIALIAGTVRNEGDINAKLGTALLAAGNKVTLNINNGSLLAYSIDQGALNALTENKQLIQANGGQVLMSARALNQLTTAVVNNTGLVEAKTIENRNGRIMLMGDMDVGTVNVAGTLDASAPTTGNGGFVETSAAHVKIADDALITTKATNGASGSWLIDPVDFTVAASGGDITGKALSTQLANNGLVTIMNTQGANGTAGDINVNDVVSWSSNSVLELIAQRNINFNSAVTATGATAGLKLTYVGDYKVKAPITLSGSNSTLNINGNNYTLIRSMSQLDLLDGNNSVTNAGTARQLTAYYALAQDLDAAGTTYTKSLLGASSTTTFLGTFAGMGHTISNLTINAAGGAGVFALIGAGSVVRDLGIVGGNIYGANGDVGAIAGRNTGGKIDNVYATGVTVGGTTRIGGVLGYLNGGTLSNSYANVTVASGNSSGGLVGTSNGSISNSYAEGEVNGTAYVGGLVGSNNAGASIVQSYASGNVIGGFGGSRAGGLVGLNSGSISYAYATGSVSADSLAGGLVAWNYPGGSVSNAYASGNVTLVANPALSGTYAGALIGSDSASTTNAVWDSSSSGHVSYTGTIESATNITDVNAGNRYQHSAYNVLGTWRETATGSGVWVAYDGGNNPQWVMVEGSTRPFLYSEWSTTVNNAHQLQLMAANLSANYTLAKNIDLSVATGSNASGMWRNSGFASIGNALVSFTGTLDGKNHTISNLFINNQLSEYVGLFGMTAAGSRVQDVSLLNASVSGLNQVGALIGYNNGEVKNTYTQGQVAGTNSVGGLVGGNTGTISTSHASATVYANQSGGGLVGTNEGQISNAYADGSVTGTRYLGGLVGSNRANASINGSYAAGQVDTDSSGGGLAGLNEGVISNSYATTEVVGTSAIGGLVGENSNLISNSYATGSVRGPGTVGGFVGSNTGSISASFWNSDIYGVGVAQGTNTGTTGISNVQVQQASTFVNAGWDIGTTGGTSTIWRIYDGLSGPLLRSFLTPVTVSATVTAINKTYDGSGTITSGYTPVAGVTLSGSLVFTSSKNAGSYSSSDGTLQQGGLYSTQQGYDISYADASLTISKANLTVTAGSASKTYDGTTTASGTVTVGTLAGAGDLVNSSGSLSFDDKNAGSGKTVIASGVAIKDASNNDVTDNYNISYVNNTNGSIAKANVTLHVTDVIKTYDGTSNAAATLAVQSGQLFGQDEVTASSFSFNNKDAANNKTVSASGITVNDGNSGNNYNVTVVDSSNSTINRAALSVTANSDSKLFDNLAYAGGNGVMLNGLVNGETIADLQGALTYGGSAQGATGAGSYIISANGLGSSNYAVTYVDGSLVIRPASIVPGELLAAYNTAVRNNSNDLPQGAGSKDEDLQIAAITPPKPDGANPSQATPRLNISACGINMPPAANNGGC